jgi:hypothetical protein
MNGDSQGTGQAQQAGDAGNREATGRRLWLGALPLVLTFAGGIGLAALVARETGAKVPGREVDEARVDEIRRNAARLIEEGRQTFRHDTFGDEVFWGRTLRLHETIAGTPCSPARSTSTTRRPRGPCCSSTPWSA